MATFYAGQRVQASALSGALPILGYAATDTAVTSSTALVNAAGVAVTLAANAFYAIDCYLAYVAPAAGDLKVAFSAPAGATGHWALMPLATSTTGAGGVVDASRATGFGDGITQAAGGSDTNSGAMLCQPHGYIATAGSAGVLQLRFAQNTANATASLVKAGAWLRATRLA